MCLSRLARVLGAHDGTNSETVCAPVPGRIVDVDENKGTVTVRNPLAREEVPRKYTFDFVFGPDSLQQDIFALAAKPLVDAALDGYNATIFAYGQTGTGKSFTMLGGDGDKRGIIPNAFNHIFGKIEDDKEPGRRYLVSVSYLEIYNEEVRDLLSKNYKRPLELKEGPDGVYVKDLSSFVVRSVDDISAFMKAGTANRSVGATQMNADSSRSHSVLGISIECCSVGPDGDEHMRRGRLNLVDLAGSERQSKTQAEGARFAEAVNINLSLSALGNVISALAEGKARHIPYRDSKLTRLLQNSLGGNSRTVMIANVGPCDFNADETISTLRYANRAKNIQNTPTINEDPKDALLRQFQDEIERLKKQLEAAAAGEGGAASGAASGSGAGPGGAFSSLASEEIEEMRRKIDAERQRLQADVTMVDEERVALQQALEARSAELEREKRERDELAQQIATLEAKVIVGGTNLLDEVERQERAIREAELELERQRREQEQLKARVEEQQSETMIERERFSSKQEEVDAKTTKFKLLYAKFQAARVEVQDLATEQAQQRDSLVAEIQEQNRTLQLLQLILTSYIPEGSKGKKCARGYAPATGTY